MLENTDFSKAIIKMNNYNPCVNMIILIEK